MLHRSVHASKGSFGPFWGQMMVLVHEKGATVSYNRLSEMTEDH
jgi:hypothetical protein